MVDITHKYNTLRIATAEAVVNVGAQETIDALVQKKVPKGDVLEVARTAGLFAVKNTSSAIPDCHPMPVESTSVSYRFEPCSIHIAVTVKTIYKTGVEVEAMHGAAIVALTIYDMLKPIDKQVEIGSIRLVEKRGGKSDWSAISGINLKVGVVVCSDRISAGEKEDRSGKVIVSKLEKLGVPVTDYRIIPDQIEEIQALVKRYIQDQADLVIFTGGTGLSHRDVTPEALIPLLDRRIPGIEEAMRSYGQERTPFAMLSRSVAGLKGDTLLLAMPGSTAGAAESMDAVFPAALHLLKLLRGYDHGQ